MNSGKSWLCAELMRTKSGYSDWAADLKTIWPQWSWERLGALAMCSDPKGDKKRSLDELMRLADKRLADAGDRGWGALCSVLDDAALTWLAVGEDSHPIHMRQWTEQDIAETIKLAKLEGMTAEAHNYFRMSDKAFNDDERRVLGWLGSSEKSMKLCALANWWRGNKVPFSVQNANHFLYAWNTLMSFPEKTDPHVFKTISHLDIEGLQDYRMSLINGNRRTLAGN